MTETKADRKIDVRGDACPYTFVKSKLAIEGLERGQVLEIIVDNDISAEDVPRSMEGYGNRVLEVKKISRTDWRILIKKG